MCTREKPQGGRGADHVQYVPDAISGYARRRWGQPRGRLHRHVQSTDGVAVASDYRPAQAHNRALLIIQHVRVAVRWLRSGHTFLQPKQGLRGFENRPLEKSAARAERP